MKDRKRDLETGQRVAFISVAVSLGLAVMKGTVGTLFGSQVLIADAIHSGADLMTHAASGVGLWMAARGKTERFPYGLYRAETLACLVVGGLILLVGADLFREGIHKLSHIGGSARFPIFPIGTSLVSAAAAFAVARMENRAGRAIGSRSLITSAKEAYLDIFTSLAVLGGILLAHFRVPYAEGAIIILISLLLVKIGAENIWTTLLILMDANLEPGLQKEIEAKATAIQVVKGVANVKIRQSGPFKMVECVILTRPSLSLYEAHAVADAVEAAIAVGVDQIESIFIHVEPDQGRNLHVMIPVENLDGLASVVHAHFARAPYYVVYQLIDGRPELLGVYGNDFLEEKEHIGVKASRMAISHGIDLLMTASIGEISFHILKSNQVDLYQATAGGTVAETIAAFRDTQLKPLTAPAHLIETRLGNRCRGDIPHLDTPHPPCQQRTLLKENLCTPKDTSAARCGCQN